MALRRTPPTRRRRHALLLLLLGVLPAALMPLLWFWWRRTLSTEFVGVALVLVGMASLGWLVWLFALPAPSPIIIDDGFLTVPFGRRHLRLALPEILVARLDGRDLVLFAATPQGVAAHGHVGGVLVPGSSFASKTGAHDVVTALRARMLHRYGQGLVDRLDDNERRQVAFQRRRPLVVWGATAICVVAFGIELWTNALSSAGGLTALGANASDRVADFEVWRVVTANFLHGSAIHLFMNLAALLSTGALVERWLGRPATVLVLWCSGSIGQLASAVGAMGDSVPRLSVGISGAVFGVLGVLFVSSVRFRGQATGGLRVPLTMWVVLVVTNGAISTIPIVDVTAHIAGFIAGAATALLVAPRPGGRPALLGPKVLRAAAAVAGVLTVLAFLALVVSTTTTAAGVPAAAEPG